MIVLVRPKTRPAITSGDGLHPLSAPWCSSSEIACEAVLVGVAGHVDERLVARRHLGGLETGLDAVEADHGVRHAGTLSPPIASGRGHQIRARPQTRDEDGVRRARRP